MEKVQLELLDRLNKVHSENNMPDTVKITPLELNDNDSVIKFNISMTPEECKDWSYIFCGDELLEYNGFEKYFNYDKKAMIFKLTYEIIVSDIVLTSDLQDE